MGKGVRCTSDLVVSSQPSELLLIVDLSGESTIDHPCSSCGGETAKPGWGGDTPKNEERQDSMADLQTDGQTFLVQHNDHFMKTWRDCGWIRWDRFNVPMRNPSPGFSEENNISITISLVVVSSLFLLVFFYSCSFE